MSQRLPDYEALRASQARSQQTDRIGPAQEGIWTMTESEFKRELADAWDQGVIYGHNEQGRLIDKRENNPHETRTP